MRGYESHGLSSVVYFRGPWRMRSGEVPSYTRPAFEIFASSQGGELSPWACKDPSGHAAQTLVNEPESPNTT